MPFDRLKYIGFDIETGSTTNTDYALQPYRAARHEADITSYATAAWDGAKLTTAAKNMPTKSQMADLLNYCIDNDLTLVGWNVSFDAAWVMAYGLSVEVHKVKWLDAMLLWQALTREPEYDTTANKRKSYSLKNAVREFYPRHGGYEDGVDFFDNSPAMVAKRLKYNQLDSAFTIKLAEKFYNRLEKLGRPLRPALIEASAISSMAEQIVNGLPVDDTHAENLQHDLFGKQAESLKVLETHGLTDTVLASPKQLSTKLYEEWGLPVLSTTPKGAPSTDKTALYLLASIDPRVAQIREYREAGNNRTKFVDKILESTVYNEDGCTRPWPRLAGTYTGRVTYNSSQGRGVNTRQTGFALHQMKRAPEFRKTIKAPPGYVLCEWDAAGQEYRWMGIESNDTRMLELCQPGQDPHTYMGAEVGHKDYFELMVLVTGGDKPSKHLRQMGKVGNLSCSYRIGVDALWETANVGFDMPLTKAEAGQVHAAYHRSYPGVQQYWARKIADARRNGYAETLAGRRVQLKEGWLDRRMRWKLESSAVNFPIQGVGADQKYLAIKILRNYLNRCGGKFFFELHDGLYAILPSKAAEKDARVIQAALNRMPYQKAWGFTPPIPLPWDLKMGPSWGEMTEIK